MYEANTLLGNYRQLIRDSLDDALIRARAAGALSYERLPDYAVEKPREQAHGDFAANLAMVLGKACGMAPRELAKLIIEHINLTATPIDAVEIAGPGFLNFRLKAGWLNEVAAQINSQGRAFGRSNSGGNQRVQVEFVSANPTGDLHMGNARGAAIGDSLASVLEMAGYQVQREFYINDAGNQIDKFARTLDALYLQQLGRDVPFPEDGYPGADLPPLMAKLIEKVGDKYADMGQELRHEYLTQFALAEKIAAIRSSLDNFGVSYDVWFSEQSLHESGAVQNVIKELDERGFLFEQDGAIWLDCARFGDEKPEVVVRANGVPTYYAADIAYHQNKFQRGFDTVIDVWGADHHGHVARMQGAMEAIGYRREQLEIILMQFVRLYQDGQLLKMSKRTGQYVTLDELVEDVGKDAARFFFILRGADSLIDFDLDLAKKQSTENPVYYVQYGHARISSILRAAAEQGDVLPEPDFHLLSTEQEQELIRCLADFPDEVATAARLREPHRVANYLLKLAGKLHTFYDHCHCIVEDRQLMASRLALIESVGVAIRNGLNAIGVNAPEQM